MGLWARAVRDPQEPGEHPTAQVGVRGLRAHLSLVEEPPPWGQAVALHGCVPTCPLGWGRVGLVASNPFGPWGLHSPWVYGRPLENTIENKKNE